MDNSEREILFRGQRKSDNKWVEGYYVHFHKTSYCCIEDADKNFDNDIHRILLEETTDWGLPNRYVGIDIRPETLGQYIGKEDKNKRKIFDGDILVSEFGEKIKVVYRAPNFALVNPNSKQFSLNFVKDCEIIGNIYDNPELVETE